MMEVQQHHIDDTTINDWMEEQEDLTADYKNLRVKHNISGYREGITAGQEYMLQNAFNQGFRNAVPYFEELSKYRGHMSALLMFLLSKDGCPKDIIRKIEELIARLEDIETNSGHINNLLKQMKQEKSSVPTICHDNVQKDIVTDSEMDELINGLSSYSANTNSNTMDGADVKYLDQTNDRISEVNQSIDSKCCSVASCSSQSGCCKESTTTQSLQAKNNLFGNKEMNLYFLDCKETIEQQIRSVLDEVHMYVGDDIRNQILKLMTQQQ